MDKELGRLVDLDTPRLNPLLANGLAVEHMKYVENYVDQVLRSASKGFPEGLTYVNCKRCTPLEEYRKLVQKKNGKSQFDVARSDLYMMKYIFQFNGTVIERYLSLPFVSDAGCITLGGSRFNISPVLSDRVISVGVSNIFVRLLRDRLTFERMSYNYIVDGSRRETVQVAWSMIYHKNAKQRKLRPTVRANCTLMHYLLCKYGFTDTFLKFGKCTPIIGGIDKVNHLIYNEDEWVICSTSCINAHMKPRGFGRGFYEPTTLQIAVRKEEMTPMVKNMIGGFFYIADHFPSYIQPEYINTPNEKRMWMVLLGHILFSGTVNAGKLYNDIEDHIASLDEYIDALVIDKLKEIGVPVNDAYELFAVIMEKYNDWLLASADKVASMYDKELSILYYVLYEITSAIFKLYFKLKAASKKVLTVKEITNTMHSTLKTGLIYSITKNHGEVSNISYSGDNKAFKITSLLVPQSGSNRQSNRKDRAVLNDPSKRLHVSVAEIGGYSNLPKSAPDGRSRLNLVTQVDGKSVILRNPKLAPLLDETQEKLKR